MKRGTLKSFADSKKLKYGTLNIILISVVLAVVILLNLVVTLLGDTFNWNVDMTEEQLYTVSDPLVELLGQISEKEGADIDIIFCCDKDVAENNYTDISSGNVLAYVHSTAIQIADRLDNVSILYADPIKEYTFMKQFTTLSTEMTPSENTVIIARKDEKGSYGSMYRVVPVQYFYTFAEQPDGSKTIYGYNGERVFASTILSLTYKVAPTVYFTTGHSEQLKNNGADVQLAEVFRLCGFNVRAINLLDTQFSCPTEGCDYTWGYDVDLDGLKASDTVTCGYCDKKHRVDEIVVWENAVERQIPEDAIAVIINQPKKDLDEDGVEASKLTDYYLTRKGTIMCFLNPTGEIGDENALPLLYQFIASYTGVTIKGDSYIDDPSTRKQGGVFDFRANAIDNSAVDAYLGTLKNYGSANPIFVNSGVLEIDEAYMSEEGFTAEGGSEGTFMTQPLFQTNSSAKYNGESGTYTVMSVTSCWSFKDNEDAFSYFVVCPSGGFVEDTSLATKYINNDVLFALTRGTTQKNTPVNLDFKTFASYELDVTESQSRTALICFVTIIPVFVVVVGVVIIIRRKNR